MNHPSCSARSFFRYLRRAAITAYAGFCALLCLITLVALHGAFPHKATWTLEEAPTRLLATSGVDNDRWRWSPAPGRELQALARADGYSGPRFLPGFGTSNRQVRVYSQFHDEQLSARIAASIKEDPRRLRPSIPRPEDGPRPAWWQPTHGIRLETDRIDESYLLRPEEPEKIYCLRKHEFTIYFPD